MPENQPNREVLSRLPYIAAVLIVGAIGVGGFAAFGARATPETQTAAAEAPNYFSAIPLEAKAAIVIDIPTGNVLYEKNADVQLPLASLTKVALALVVAEALLLDTKVPIPHYIEGSTGTEHLSKGEVWPLSNVIDFTLVASSNSGAELLAKVANDAIHARYAQSPADSATLWRMNDLSRELDLKSTFFLNVNGLDLSPTQAGAYGSARDMALLFAYAASADPSLFAGTAQDGILLTSRTGNIIASNTNDAQRAIPGLIMGKTGLTDLAGGNLAVVFDVGLAHPVVAVVLGSSEKGRFSDMQRIVTASRKTIIGTP